MDLLVRVASAGEHVSVNEAERFAAQTVESEEARRAGEALLFQLGEQCCRERGGVSHRLPYARSELDDPV